MRNRFSQKNFISLNLGGGAARGYAHIGVIKCFEEERIPFHGIIGVSMGAIVGNVYATVPEAEFLEERMIDLIKSENFRTSPIGTWTRTMEQKPANLLNKMNQFYAQTGIAGRIFLAPGILPQEGIEATLHPYIADINIENTRLPFATVAVDLAQGNLHVFDSGPMRPAVLASAALPLVFPPQVIDNTQYTDGGVLDKVGIDSAHLLGVQKMIAVDVSDEDLPEAMIKNSLDVMLRSEEISSRFRRLKQLQKADVVIQPIKGNIHWADYNAYRELIDQGYENTCAEIERIRDALKLTHPFKRFFSFFNRLK